MGKRLKSTPRSIVRSAIRRIWLRSRERAAALRRTGYCCERCGVKQSKAKGKECTLEVHHINEAAANMEMAIDAIFACVLHPDDQLMPLCEACHKEMHPNARRSRNPALKGGGNTTARGAV